MRPVSDTIVLMTRAVQAPIVQMVAKEVIKDPEMAMCCSWPKVKAGQKHRLRRPDSSLAMLVVAAHAHMPRAQEAFHWCLGGAMVLATSVGLGVVGLKIASATSRAKSLLLPRLPHVTLCTSIRLSCAPVK